MKAPFNLLHISVEEIPTSCLCDSGSAVSLISQQFYQRLKAKLDKSKTTSKERSAPNLYAANNSKLCVRTAVDLSVRLQGLTIVVHFIVVAKLACNAVLGADFLHDTQASINFGDRQLVLYEGLLSVPLHDTSAEQTARTVSNVALPPRSQVNFSVACHRKMPPGTVRRQHHQRLPSDLPIVANTRVRPTDQRMFCCASKTSNKPISSIVDVNP